MSIDGREFPIGCSLIDRVVSDVEIGHAVRVELMASSVDMTAWVPETKVAPITSKAWESPLA